MRNYLTYIREDTFNCPPYSYWIDILMTRGGYPSKVREWLKKQKDANSELPPDHALGQYLPSDVQPPKKWESDLLTLAGIFEMFHELSPWERTVNEDRFRHSRKVAKAARELAEALEEPANPGYPPVFGLFDEDAAEEIIGLISDKMPPTLIRYTKLDPKEKKPLFPLNWNLAIHLPHQKLPALLRRLAEFADEQCKEPRRDNKPNHGDANARAFGRHLATEFSRLFRCTPNDVIADCVMVRYPDIDPPVTGELVRRWRGAR